MGCVAAAAFQTIPQGESYLLCYGSGETKVVEGPQRLSRCNKSFTHLELKTAADDEYLEVVMRDGRRTLRRGPTSIVQDPTQHSAINVMQMTKLRNQELIVVYRPSTEQSGGTTQAERHVVHGPRMYMPESAAEWSHQFSWTDVTDEDAKKKDKTGALKFTVLQNAPGKIYHKVERVRTKDNALLTVKLMIFFCFQNIEAMLDNTMDPYADITNATSADVIEWCVSKLFDEFLASAEELNSLEVYRQLSAVTKKVGVEVQKVVFRGYEAPERLQLLHDRSIEERTKLELSRKAEEEQQSLAEYKLQKEQERSTAEHEMEMAKLEHELKMQEKRLDVSKMEREFEMERLGRIKKVDPKADIVKYLIAKEAPRAQVVQCGSLFSGGEVEVKV